METIKNYLESMFANLPNTPEVMRAKDELYQMMEDKYADLIAAGKPEHEAVGIVISELGNLDELAESLGIDSIVHGEEKETYAERFLVTLDMALDYVKAEGMHAFMIGVGVFLCIISPIVVIMGGYIEERTGSGIVAGLGVIILLTCIAMAVGIFIVSGTYMNRWSFLKKEPCCIDYSTAEYLIRQRELNRSSKVLTLTIGILLCVLCASPLIMMQIVANRFALFEYLGVVSLLVMVAMGVLLIIASTGKESAYKTLLNLNQDGTVSGTYREADPEEPKVKNFVTEVMLPNYWQTVTCIYLIYSFLTFSWGISWIIWPIAGILRKPITDYFYKRG